MSRARKSKKRDTAQSKSPAAQASHRRWLTPAAILVMLLAGSVFLFVSLHDGPPPQHTGGQGDRSPAAHSPIEAEFLAIAEKLKKSHNEILGGAQVGDIRRQLEDRSLSLPRQGDLHSILCLHLLRLGDTQGALAELERTFEIAGQLPGFKPQQWSNLHKVRALVYLRQAEVSNCVKHQNRDCCLFPIRRGGVHQEKGPALEARKSLLESLEFSSNSLGAVWLLNVLSMAIGDHPEGVPEAQRIPASAFESEYDIKKFVDVAPELGIHTFNLCGGVIVDDFNDDNLLDIVTSTHDPSGPLTFFCRQADGRFEDTSEFSSLNQQLGGLNCIGADYDNDGDVDVLVLREAWLYDDGQIRNSLLRNNGDGTFSDVTRQAGLADPARPTQAAVWADFDSDGDLDLYVGNES